MAGNQDPIVILVNPQLGENIGMCARAMLNCGLRELRLVEPRDGWPQDSARAAAADADEVIDSTRAFPTLDEAIADCQAVFATTARDRSIGTPVRLINEAASEMASRGRAGERVAMLFGPEASGLDREAASRADFLIRIPTNPEFPSLNLAQAVLLVAWEWRRADGKDRGVDRAEPATRGDLGRLIDRFDDALDEKGFYLTPELKPHSQRTMRSLLSRMNATTEEVQFLHGVLSALLRDEGEGGTGIPPGAGR